MVWRCWKPALARAQYCSFHAAEFHAAWRFTASKRYWAEDIIEPEVPFFAGTIAVPKGRE